MYLLQALHYKLVHNESLLLVKFGPKNDNTLVVIPIVSLTQIQTYMKYTLGLLKQGRPSVSSEEAREGLTVSMFAISFCVAL